MEAGNRGAKPSMISQVQDRAAPLPGSQRFATRALSFGILAVLLALLACAVWGAAATYGADVAVKRATEASNAAEALKKDLAAERMARRGGGVAPGEAARMQHREAAQTVATSLARAHVFTDGADRRLIEDMQARHNDYLAALGVPLGETGENDPARADTVAADAAARLQDSAEVASERFRVEALAMQQGLVAIQQRVLIGGPVFFGLGLMLVGVIWRLQRSAQRRSTARQVQDAFEAGRGDRRFVGVVENAPDMVLICAGPGNILYSNAAATTLWSFDDGQLDGQSVLTLAHLMDQPALRAWWQQLRPAAGAVAVANQHSLELRLRDGAGLWRPVELVGTNLLHHSAVQGIVLTIRDVGQRRMLEQERTDQALLDPLTRLPNTMLLRDRLHQALVRAGRQRDTVAVLSIGFDGLSAADDRYGAGSVDALALEAATRIQACVRPQDTVARLDRATFAVLRDPVVDDRDAEALAEAIAVQFSRPLQSGATEVVIPVRIGVALGGARAVPAEALLRNTGLAMRRVEPAAAVRHAMFEEEASSALLDRVELESDLRGAVQRLVRDGGLSREFRVHYQPIVSLGSSEPCGFEALIRWQHPNNGLVAPKDFIPMAEEAGLIVPLGQWVLEEACRQVVAWQERFRFAPALTLSVNLSSLQFQQERLVADVARALSAAGLASSCLRLEVTEGTIMRDPDAAVRTLWALKELGVTLAIDDFGSGYSALPYLKQLPLGMLKIDDSFVSGIGRDQEDTATVRAVMSLAKSLGWGVTAEGIETPAQARLLEGWGCEFGQGYHFGRPLDGEEAGAMLDGRMRQVRGARRLRADAGPV